jgi:hypothetical protein
MPFTPQPPSDPHQPTVDAMNSWTNLFTSKKGIAALTALAIALITAWQSAWPAVKEAMKSGDNTEMQKKIDALQKQIDDQKQPAKDQKKAALAVEAPELIVAPRYENQIPDPVTEPVNEDDIFPPAPPDGPTLNALMATQARQKADIDNLQNDVQDLKAKLEAMAKAQGGTFQHTQTWDGRSTSWQPAAVSSSMQVSMPMSMPMYSSPMMGRRILPRLRGSCGAGG